VAMRMADELSEFACSFCCLFSLAWSFDSVAAPASQRGEDTDTKIVSFSILIIAPIGFRTPKFLSPISRTELVGYTECPALVDETISINRDALLRGGEGVCCAAPGAGYVTDG
jgi:hypothetical protein